jgi:histidinol-phosphate phosphatase family protein
MPRFPAVFLDRDGVIIENRANYVRSWDDVSFLPGVFPALRRLFESPYRIVIVTNQSAVGRGLLTLELAKEINTRIVNAIEEQGGRIDSMQMCPHTPQDKCSCRKPEPGMLIQASAEFSLDLATSVLIGDSRTDLLAGKAAGIGHLVLVRTGLGADQESLLEESGLSSIHVFDDLAKAISRLPLALT